MTSADSSAAPATDCPQCGSPLVPGALLGNCPRCLARSAFVVEEEPPDEPSRPGEAIPWAVLGDCELLDEIGRGGMGIVFRARQRSLGREVAVKVLRGGSLASVEARKRFKSEAENVARLHHPGIVAVHDFGEEQGVCWISMDLIAGRDLDAVTRQTPMAARTAAECVRDIARAVQHAHAHGVLHRDLKPSNILLDPDNRPHIADFGIARRIRGAETFTRTGQMLGSPGYTAPEQALHGTGDERTDVYGLGAILYSVLSSRPPFQGPTVESVLLMLHESDPVPLRQFVPTVPRDLETICAKALAKDPANRFPDAAGFVAELERFLAGEPILSRPPSIADRTLKWVRRHPANAAMLALLLAGIVSAFLLVDQARREEAGARQQEHAAKMQALAGAGELLKANEQFQSLLDTTELESAEDRFRRGEGDHGRAILAHVLRRTPHHPVAGPRLASTFYQGGAAMPVLMPFIGLEQAHLVQRLGKSNGLFVGRETGAAVLDPDTGRPQITFSAGGDRLKTYVISPDERFLAGWATPSERLHFWDLTTGQALPPAEAAGVRQGAFSPDGTLFLAAGDGIPARWYNVAAGAALTDAPAGLAGSASPSVSSACAISPDGSWAATEGQGEILLWQLPARTVHRRIPLEVHGLSRLVFSRDSTLLAGGGEQGKVIMWELARPDQPLWEVRYEGQITALEFSKCQQRLLAASRDATARIWNVRTGLPRSKVMRHTSVIRDAHFDPLDRSVVTVSEDNSARLWDAGTGEPESQPMQHAERVFAATFSEDAMMLWTAGADGAVQRWRLQGSRFRPLLLAQPAVLLDAAWSPDGTRIATTAEGGMTALWDPDTGRMTAKTTQPQASSFIAFPPQAPGVLLSRGQEGITLMPPDLSPTGERHFHMEKPAPQRTGAFSPDGSRCAAGDPEGHISVWDTASGRLLFPTLPPRQAGLESRHVEFSPDGKWLLSVASRKVDTHGDDDSFVRDAATGVLRCELSGHPDNIYSARFSPDGKWIATAGMNDFALIHDASSGQPVTPRMRHSRGLAAIAWSPDGRRVATGSGDHTARIWDAATGLPVSPPLPHEGAVIDLTFSPDGQRLATASGDHHVRLWHPDSGLLISEPLYHNGAVTKIRFSPDGQRLLSVVYQTEESFAFVWHVPAFPAPPPPWLVDLTETLARPELEANPVKMLALTMKYQAALQAMAAEPPTSPYHKLARRLLGTSP